MPPEDVSEEAPPGSEFPDIDLEGEPLKKLERMAALAVGLLAGGAGGWAVLNTENQVGSASLVVIGAAFLLIAVQGTPLARFSNGSNSIELRKRRARAQMVVERAQQEEDPDVAAAVTEAASIIEPTLLQHPHFRADLYLSRLEVAVKALGLGVARTTRDQYIYDFIAFTGPADNESSVAISVKYRDSGPLRLAGMERFLARNGNRNILPMLVVTNAEIEPSLQEHAKESYPLLRIVKWSDGTDTPSLSQAIRDLLS
ncbi:hypothetical protein ACFY1S_16210 [Micromonospora sp. NPDC000663]|uniref:hypothetical protein n=1 Tax=Micromonospora sp. NPDC000663 TaxID=3364218 RepID=UPI00367B378A